MVDDITITQSDNPVTVYNIYRDGTLIASNVTATTYIDQGFNSSVGHTWSVKVACPAGEESDPVSATKGSCESFIPVTNITGVPTTATVTVPLTLTATVVPSNATNKTIVWSVVSAGGTGATINGNTFKATAAGTATIKATIANGSAVGTPYTQNFNITVTLAQLTGTVTITGNTFFGETLTANTSGLSSTPQVTLGTLTYQWKRDGNVISGASSSTYKLVQADIGSKITVTVTAANCSNNVTSSPTNTVEKATQAAPAAPTLASKTTTSITLNSIADCEYRRNNNAWQTSVLFSDLTPNTDYQFEARKMETVTHYASPASPSATFTTESLGVNENDFLNVKIYSYLNSVYIKNESNIALKSVEITDVFGRIVYQDFITDLETVIVLQAANGIYFVKLILENESTKIEKVSILR
jgi:hypothetical protein